MIKKVSTLNKTLVIKTLRNVLDPELGVNVVDLGLIYNITIDSKLKHIKVLMTLTSPFCPYNSFFLDNIKQQLYQLGAKQVEIELTFNPLWSPSRINKKVKLISSSRISQKHEIKNKKRK